MKKFWIKIWFTETEDKEIIKEQEMVTHIGGLTYADICAIENFIENITHNKHDKPKFHNELVRLKTLWEEMVQAERNGD